MGTFSGESGLHFGKTRALAIVFQRIPLIVYGGTVSISIGVEGGND